MKHLFAYFLLLFTLSAISQTPTYRWLGGDQDYNNGPRLEKTAPGPRRGASSFVDAEGNFWLFGGLGNDYTRNFGHLNDLWKLDRNTSEWIWVEGQNVSERAIPDYNNALSFDGFDDQATFTENPINYKEEFTVELWFKTDEGGSLLSSSPADFNAENNGWSIVIENASEILVKRFYGDVILTFTTVNLLDNQWHHIALVHDLGDGLFVPESISLFLDGSLGRSINIDFAEGLDNTGSHKTIIGASSGNGNQDFFSGEIDELRFWNTVRREDEINIGRNIQLSGTEDGLKSYLDFNQGEPNGLGNYEELLTNKVADGSQASRNNEIFREGVFIGEIGDFRVWSKFLGQEEVRSAAENQVVGSEPDLALAFQFDTGDNPIVPEGDNSAVTTLVDLSTSDDGFLSNFSLQGSNSNFKEGRLRVTPSRYNFDPGGRALVTADLDNDNYLDMIIASYDGQSISVLLNDQNGGFLPSTTSTVGTFVVDIATGNWNNDSFSDVAVVAFGDNPDDEIVRIFYGDGTGGFASTQDLSLAPNSEPKNIRTGDFNQDSIDDFIVFLSNDRRLELYSGDGGGNFSVLSVNTVLSGRPENTASGIVVDDFNNDNYPDVVISLREDNNCGKLGVLINDQSGDFDPIFIDEGGCLYSQSIATTDFNGDGNRDIVFVDGNGIGSVEGNGDGTFSGEAYFECCYGFIRSFDLQDIDGDGVEDMIATENQSTAIFLGTDNGEFIESEKYEIGYSEDILTADFNNDGFFDIAGLEYGEVKILLRESDFFNQAGTIPTLRFDGIDDFVAIPNLKVFDSDFTIEGWINTQDNGPIFAFTNGNPSEPWAAGHFALVIKDGRLTFLVNGYTEIQAFNEASLFNGDWHHIAASISIDPAGQDFVELFVDGNYVGGRGEDFDAGIDNANGDLQAKLGYASQDFKSELGATGLSPLSNFVDGVTLSETNEARTLAAHWSDGENLYVFGGHNDQGTYNSLRKYQISVTKICPDLAGSSYSFNSVNAYTDFGTIADQTGTGTMQSGSSDGAYLFDDISFGVIPGGYGAGSAVGPELIELCSNPSIIGTDQFGISYSILSPITRSPDGSSITFTWSNDYNTGMGATTTITLDEGVWPEFEVEAWTLISGSNEPNDAGNYGVIKVADPSNVPPARQSAPATMDQTNSVWIFGGVAENGQRFNDLWRFDSQSEQWMWVSGSEYHGATAIYGTKGQSSSTNIPGPRSGHLSWSDENGNIWIFGGIGIDSQGSEGRLNDLWKFDPNSSEWTWVNGSNMVNQKGEYGTMDVYSETNVIGARNGAIQWKDPEGKIWIFGGTGLDKNGVAVDYLNDLWSYDPTLNQWAWHSGSDFRGSTGYYNEVGLASVDYVPGARFLGSDWMDENGNLYLLGGFQNNQITTGFYNDFWKYEPASKEWTWLSGFRSTAEQNQFGVYGEAGSGSNPFPGSRHGGMIWKDIDDVVWLYGGNQRGSSISGNLTDLWKYEPQKGEWTYVRGSTKTEDNDGVYGTLRSGSQLNEPAGRWHGATWAGDDGKLWLFGGLDYNPSTNATAWLNDLWSYDPDSDIWTWMGGSSQLNSAGVFGTKGEASTAHIPGAKSSAAFWKDEDGNFWLFGGYEKFEYNNDLWKFNPNTLEWTWMSGNSFQNTPSVYGEKGVASEDNEIGARRYMDAWVDNDGYVWIFGGLGYDGEGILDYLNDLWKYDPNTNLWTFMGNSTESGSVGNYGELGIPHPDNVPSARTAYDSWTDDSGNLWLFGGFGVLGETKETSAIVVLNDLWKYDTKSNMWTWMGGANGVEVAAESLGSQGIFDEGNMLSPRERSHTFSYNKSLYLFGGRRIGSQSKNDFWEIRMTPGETFVESPSAIAQTGFEFSYDEPWATSFQLQVAASDDFSEVFLDQTRTSKNAAIGSLNPGTIYYYRLNAINDIGESGFGETQSTLTRPATPTFESLQLAVSDISSTTAGINWLTTPGILDGYEIDVSTDASFSDEVQFLSGYNKKPLDVSTRELISDLQPGTRYYVRLRSFNASGSSPYSQVIDFLTTPETPTFEPNEVLTNVAQRSASVTWNSVPETLTGYRITISTDETFSDPMQILEDYNNRVIPKTRVSSLVQGLNPGTQYFAYLTAFNSSGQSEPSSTISILTLPESPVFAVDGSLLSATQSSARIAWTAPNEIFEGFKLEVSTDFSFNNSNLMLEGYGRENNPKVIDKTITDDEILDLDPGQTYFARIRSYNASGDSPNSNIIQINTVPRSPVFNTPGNITQEGASLSWLGTPGTETYLLDLNTSQEFDPGTAVFTEFPIAVTFQVLSELNPGTRYFARIQSSNPSGSSGALDPADYNYTTFITIPQTPDLNDPSEVTQTSIRVSWPEVDGATAYEVDVSDNFFQTFLIGYNASEVAVPEILISGLSPGTQYQVRVRAKNTSGESPNASNFDLLTIPQTPIARDATNFSSRLFTANWDPASGATYYVLEVSSDDFNSLHYSEQVVSSNPVQIEDLQAGATYKYRVRSGNASGESPNSNVITIVAQNSSQSLNINSVVFAEKIGENTASTPVTVSVGGGAENPSVTIRHRQVLSSQWSDFKPMTQISATNFEFNITASMLDDIGVEFEIYANDGITFVEDLGNVIKKSFSESSSESLPTLSLGEWQMISIPYVLDDNLVTSIFNELGDLQYRKQWRLMSYLNGEYQDQGVGFTRVELGRGYWFNSLADVVINVGAGETNSSIPYVMPLEQGWNQIGNPFNVPVNWSAQVRENNLVTVVDDLVIYDRESNQFVNADILNPFEGAFAWADEATSITINPQIGASGRMAESLQSSEGPEWKIEFSVASGSFTQTVAGFGMDDQAKLTKDSWDKVTIPRFLNYLEMSTFHEDYFYPHFSHDVVPRQDSYQWSFTLSSNMISGATQLLWEAKSLPAGYLWLVDELSGKVVEMSSESSLQFNYTADRDFTVHYSLNPDYEALPKRIIVEKIYPNPTTGSAQLHISLPADTNLSLQLFDLQGKMVKYVSNSAMHAGKYVLPIVLDEDEIPDGFYLLKVQADGKQVPGADQKIIIRR